MDIAWNDTHRGEGDDGRRAENITETCGPKVEWSELGGEGSAAACCADYACASLETEGHSAAR